MDSDKVAKKWVDNHAVALAAKSPESDTARRWLDINVHLDMRALEAALKQVYGSGWAFGTTDSNAQIFGEIADPWDGWIAGNEAAAALVNPPKGLKNLLAKSKTVIDGIKGTLLDQLGVQLGDALSRGLGAEETASLLSDVVDNPLKAMVIARTETARADIEANVSNYRDNNITQMQWFAIDPCKVCQLNDGEIVDIGEEFSSGHMQPPAHPNCFCAVTPVGRVELSDKTINKYSPDQERDDNGRFSSGGGSSESETDYRMQHQPNLREDEFGSPAHDIEEMMPKFYEHPEWYTHAQGSEFGQAYKESVAAVMAIKDKPDAVVTIYRAAPTSVTEINQGDWISLSPTYAALHNESNLNGEGHVISMQVTAKDLWFNGDDINEFGYDPVSESKFIDTELNKYSPDQERDERGRFGSGSGSSEATPTDSNDSGSKPLPSEEQIAEWQSLTFDNSGQGDEAPELKWAYDYYGMHGTPTVSDSEFQKLKDEGATIIYRGVSRDGNTSPQEMTDQFRNGDTHYAGFGYDGNGTYTSTSIDTAKEYARAWDGNPESGAVMEMAIKPDANFIEKEDLVTEYAEKVDNNPEYSDMEKMFLSDPSNFCLHFGYDGIKVDTVKIRNGIKEDYYIVLDRTALVMPTKDM